MKKLQGFYIFKFDSGRLKEYKYNIKELTIDRARINGELVTVSDSEVIRTIRKITKKEFSQYKLDGLTEEKDKLSRRKNSKENREKLKKLNKSIDEMLFVPEIVSIHFRDKRHYLNILSKSGFFINGIKYVPFLSSAGMVRRDTSLFIDSSIKEEILNIFENGRDKNIEIIPQKYSAYFSLFSSTTIPVTFPRIAVVPDFIIKTKRTVDYSIYIEKDIDPLIEEKTIEVECNAFDGEGLVSPVMAKKWARDLELDYLPSVFGIRAPFLKGMVCTFDFHRFSAEITRTNLFKDIYGNEIDIQNVDCLVSESQFKLWAAYENTEKYINKCKENNLSWGITKVNPKKDKNYARTSYQFLQVLNLENDDIESLCKPTLDWLSFVSGGDLNASLLYSLGDVQLSDNWFKKLDLTAQALLLENSLLTDSYFVSHFDRNIAKKKNDARIGRLIFNGNYQVMIADPYAFISHVFGFNKELLKDGEHYSKYWQDRDIKQVAAIRSPIVHASEVNVLNIQNRDDANDWFQFINSGIIYPANGIGMDSAIHSGSDFDLDLVCTMDSLEIINGRVVGLPILYENKKADKIKIDDNTRQLVIDNQVNQIGKNKIGFYTNCSSSMYALLDDFEEGSKERNVLLQRLKYGRVLQGLAIDSAKGLLVDPFPEHFVKWKRVTEDMSEEEKEYWQFNNRILADKRPYFMRFLYSHYNRKYMNELSIYNNICLTRWNLTFEEVINLEEHTEEQAEIINRYYRRSFFINNDSVMNRISRYIDNNLKRIKKERLNNSQNFDHTILFSKGYKKPQKTELDKIQFLYKEWKSLKRSLKDRDGNYHEEEYDSIDQIQQYINKKAYSTISSNSEELADLAIYLCYVILGKNSKSFCWQIFGKEIVNNIRNKKNEKFARVPMPKENGDIEYLWSRYSIYLLGLEEIGV